MGDEDRLHVAGPDRRRRMPDMQQERGPAHAGAVHPGRGDAERVRDLDRAGRVDGGDAVDIAHGQPGVGDRIHRGLQVQLERRLAGQFPDLVGLGRSGDDDALVRAHALAPARRGKDRQADLAALLEGHLQFHVQDEVLRGVRDAGDVRHHPRSLGELDDGNRVRAVVLEAARGPVVDHVGVQGGPAAGGKPLHVGRTAGRADRPGIEVRLAAVEAALQQEFAAGAAVPERLRLRRRLGDRLARGCRHRRAQPGLPGCGLNERSTWSARSSSCHGSWPISRTTGAGLLYSETS